MRRRDFPNLLASAAAAPLACGRKCDRLLLVAVVLWLLLPSKERAVAASEADGSPCNEGA